MSGSGGICSWAIINYKITLLMSKAFQIKQSDLHRKDDGLQSGMSVALKEEFTFNILFVVSMA